MKRGDRVRIKSILPEWNGQSGVIVNRTLAFYESYYVRVVPAPPVRGDIVSPWPKETIWNGDQLTLITGLDVMLDLL